MKKNKLVFLFFSLVSFSLTGCMQPVTKRDTVSKADIATEQEMQREIALRQRRLLESRLDEVSYPLLKASAGLCELEKEPIRTGLGLHVANKYTFKKELQKTAINIFGVTDKPQVTYVMKNGPAYAAGVKKGDSIISLNGITVTPGKNSIKSLVDIYANKLSPENPVDLVVMRNGRSQNIQISPDSLCRYVVLLTNDDAVNAYADGSKIIITKGMMRFTDTDDELALVVSHEIAHNLMDHMDARRVNMSGGLALDILAALAGVNTQGAFSKIAGNAHSKGFESEADYVGMYILARAGKPFNGAAHFWRRMAAEHPKNIESSHSATHPATAERFLAIESTSNEITEKVNKQIALVPERKELMPQDTESESSDAEESAFQ